MSRSLSLATLLFFAVSAVGLYLVYLNDRIHGSELLASTPKMLSSTAYEIEHVFSDAIHITQIIEPQTLNKPFHQDFDRFAVKILDRNPVIASLQLLPVNDTAISYPMVQSDGDSHLDLVQKTKPFDALSNSPKPSVSGPIKGSNGEHLFVVKNPVYNSGDNSLWGYTSAVIRLNDLLGVLDVSTITKQGYYLELATSDSPGGQFKSLYSNGLTLPTDAEQLQIEGVDGSLFVRLGCTDKVSWMERAIGLALTLAFALTSGLLGYRILREPELLREKVANQTRDLQNLAYTDKLTTLPNRKAFYAELSKLTAKSSDSNQVGLLLFDLDNFSLINDTMGHATGDRVLRAVAARVAASIPKSICMARLGGDEFTLILAGNNINQKLTLLAEKVRLCFNKPFAIKGTDIYLTTSIGYARLTSEVNTADKLLVAADQALFHAKQPDYHPIACFTEDMLEAAKRNQQLTHDLREAITRQQFELYYQPILHTERISIRKCEALIRWNHPLLGSISPMEFIPLAEQSGLITEIGEWVFSEATTQLASWRERIPPNFQISINVSPVQFNTHDLASRWSALLKQKHLDSSAILLEITENVLMKNSSHTQAQLSALRAAGFEVALDDFGTGYCSLAYLNSFNIDYVKIDRAFIKNITVNSEDKIVCTGIIAIATKLGLKVVAEGIETSEQHELMIKEGSHYCQGYLFSKPLSAAEFEEHFLSADLFSSNTGSDSGGHPRWPDYVLDDTVSMAIN